MRLASFSHCGVKKKARPVAAPGKVRPRTSSVSITR